MEISEKKKKAIFHKCLHNLRKSENGEYLQEYFKAKRDDLLSLIDQIKNGENSKSLFEERLNKLLKIINTAFIENCIIPEKENYIYQIDCFDENVRNLIEDIKDGIINFDKVDKATEWGGAEVIISSDENRIHGEGDIFLCTRLSYSISWLMLRLRDLSTGCVNFINKYEFYETIALSAKKFIEKYGDTDEMRSRLTIHILNDILVLLEKWRKRSMSTL